MALSARKKEQLARMDIPSEGEMRDRAHRFMRRSGMVAAELAQEIGYAASGFNQFMRGAYDAHHEREGNSLAMRAELKHYMDVHDIQHVVEEGRHHPTAAFAEVRRAAMNALQRGTAYVLDGPPGTKKSWSLLQIDREIREKKLGRCVYVYARVNHSPLSFVQECCVAADVTGRGNMDQLLRKLRFFLASGRTLLMVDEAQHLNNAALAVLRQLLDLPPFFGVVLAGSHDLTQRLSRWDMEQWHERVRKTIHMNGPTDQEARAILRAELGNISEADCTATIAGCMAQAVRMQMVGGKPKQVPFTYISERLLHFAIERTQETLQLHRQKTKGAA